MRNDQTEFVQLPANPARDFFLRQVNFDQFLDGVDGKFKPKIKREFFQMAFLLNIRTLSMKLDSTDWRVVSRVMLSLVIESLRCKCAGPFADEGI